MKNIEYHTSLTTFEPAMNTERWVLKEWPLVSAAADQMSGANAVLVVEALRDGIDYGNFYLFTNTQDIAHVVLHEHRELLLVDRSREHIGDEVGFKDENGAPFTVPASRTTSLIMAKAALESWLPNQTLSDAFAWQ